MKKFIESFSTVTVIHLTDREIQLLSAGLCNLIEQASRAAFLPYLENTDAIETYIKELQALNSKINSVENSK